MVEVDAVKMPAVVVDVVFTANLAVGWDVDAAIDLVDDRLSGAARENRFGLRAQPSHRLGPFLGWRFEVAAARVAEPIGHRDVVGFRIRADGGGEHMMALWEGDEIGVGLRLGPGA